MKISASTLFNAAILAVLVACGGSKNMAKGDPMVAVLSSNPNLSKLVSMANSAGVSDLFNSHSPVTFFAPSNEAIEALGAETIAKFSDPANKEMLRKAIKNHLVAQPLTSAQLAGMDKVMSETDLEIPVKRDGDQLMVGSANVVKADMAASNGYVHVIDKVLIPN